MTLQVGLVSLGCAKNLVDSEVMLGILQDKGYSFTEELNRADALIVNTCGFIDSAKEESVKTILALSAYKTEGHCRALVVTGCLAQKYKERLLKEMPEIDGILGTGDINGIVDVLEKALAGNRTAHFASGWNIYNHLTPRVQSTPGYSAYIKIAEGCNNRCSYCIIPELRGPLMSRPMESVISEARTLAARGVKELILVAQDTTRYGEDLYGRRRLPELLRELNKIEGLVWIRLLYAYPNYFDRELMDAIAELDKVCKYIDLPLQHINDEILRSMHRASNKKEIISLIQRLRDRIPGVTLRTSLIVGFPGETEEQFQELLDFVQEIKFNRLGVFTYSREEDTPAAKMPNQIKGNIKEFRLSLLMQAQQQISLAKNLQKVGQIITVLVEGKSEENPELYVGRSEADAPDIDGLVYVRARELNSGDFVPVRITHAENYDLIGEVPDESC